MDPNLRESNQNGHKELEESIKRDEKLIDLLCDLNNLKNSSLINKFDPKNQNIFFWFITYDSFLKQHPNWSDEQKLNYLNESFDPSIVKMIKIFREQFNSNYDNVKMNLIQFVYNYLNRGVNPVCRDHVMKMKKLFEECNLTFTEEKYLLSCYCPLDELMKNMPVFDAYTNRYIRQFIAKEDD